MSTRGTASTSCGWPTWLGFGRSRIGDFWKITARYYSKAPVLDFQIYCTA